VRSVSQTEARLKEASKLGFKRAIVPKVRRGKSDTAMSFFDLQIDECALLGDIEVLFTHSVKARKDKIDA
jgi:predicted ATP-dependent serine protease